ncbi:MAG: hypothetical protein RL456_936 [Pseudomonadota bacterium]|jgi:hypothetical protein
MSTVAQDLLHQIDRLGAGAALPRVRALHLPPASAAAGSRAAGRGEFCAIELDDGTLGLAYVLLDDHHDRLLAGEGCAGLAGASVAEVAAGLRRGYGPGRVLAWAAVQAASRWLHDRAGYRPPDSRDSFGQLRLGPGEALGMIGWFGPLIERVLASGARLTVLELRPELVGERERLRVTLDPAALAGCAQVICTSTVLFNDTLDATLAHCRAARDFAVIGPGAGCLPDALFARGVTMLGGSAVTDAPACLDAIRAGAPLSGCTRKTAIVRGEHPGFEALLARL